MKSLANPVQPEPIKPGSPTHKILAVLASSDDPVPLNTLKKLSGSSKSATELRLQLEHLARQKLVAFSQVDRWAITDAGLEANLLAGPVQGGPTRQRTPSVKRAEVYQRPSYIPSELGRTCMRPGAYDAYALPSRMGDALVYPRKFA